MKELMEREIKFRVWDDSPTKSGFKGLMIGYEYVIQSSYLIDALNGKYPLMQFTGLKDKNGVEIYEGDIIQDTIVEMKSQIIFTDYANFGLKSKHIKDLEYETIDPAWSESSCEVIGNIHENPELL